MFLLIGINKILKNTYDVSQIAISKEFVTQIIILDVLLSHLITQSFFHLFIGFLGGKHYTQIYCFIVRNILTFNDHC